MLIINTDCTYYIDTYPPRNRYFWLTMRLQPWRDISINVSRQSARRLISWNRSSTFSFSVCCMQSFLENKSPFLVLLFKLIPSANSDLPVSILGIIILLVQICFCNRLLNSTYPKPKDINK